MVDHLPSETMEQVIVVDDNDDDLYLVKLCYEEAGYSRPMLQFTSGREFLDHLRCVRRGQAPNPHIVLLDLNMPGLNGLEVLERIGDETAPETMPEVWMFTSSTDPADRERALALGARGLVVKPDSMDDYVKLFARLLQNRN